MNKAIVAAAACLAMLTAVSPAAFAAEEKAKTKTVALQSKVTTSGYASSKGSVGAAAKAANPYSPIITKYAKAYGVPVELAHAVVKVESNFNPKARGRAGEVGLMQIKPATARMMGYKGSVKDLYKPETNIEFGMKYLGAAHELGGGKTCGTILKYNAGHGAKRMNPVSKRYCGKVMALLES
jgi:soluble lytic murein transglycosylase-like protein